MIKDFIFLSILCGGMYVCVLGIGKCIDWRLLLRGLALMVIMGEQSKKRTYLTVLVPIHSTASSFFFQAYRNFDSRS